MGVVGKFLVVLLLVSVLFGAYETGYWRAQADDASSAPRAALTWDEAAEPNAREQYYRALYDDCMTYPKTTEADCLALTGRRAENKWYEEASPGWVWPLLDGPR